ncbi:hypothetical protein M0R45_036616 [Rubus argutus]|uniref:DUF4220 domain-containing protein n=1 Tax=Rubus argutus TaxID=59490 RepID=A0AAW1VQ71_RUBAR
MGDPIPNSIWKIWDDWNIRGFILLSLSLQIFLILCAPLRKRTSNMWIMSLIWTAYLLANWVASFTIGLIASSQRDKDHGSRPIDVHLLAFWSSFSLDTPRWSRHH